MAAALTVLPFPNALEYQCKWEENGIDTCAIASAPAPAARAGGGVYWSASSTNNSNYIAGATRPPPGSSGSYVGQALFPPDHILLLRLLVFFA